jgi:hypothetical protein
MEWTLAFKGKKLVNVFPLWMDWFLLIGPMFTYRYELINEK